jgi:hypothetical protein
VTAPRGSPTTPRHHALHRFLRPGGFGRLPPSDGQLAARSIYGAILVLALLLALQEHPPGPFRAALLVSGTVLAVLAAEVYAEVLGMEFDLGRTATREEFRHELRKFGPITLSAEVPVLVLVLSGFGLFSEHLAFQLAIWLTVALIAAEGFLARRLAGRSLFASLRSACVLGGIGIALAVFKQLAH